LIPQVKLYIIFIFYFSLLIYLFTGLFLSYYYCFYLVILLSVVIIRYQVIFFVHGYMKSSEIEIFTGDQLKRSQTKQVLKSHILRNYVSKENSNEAFPKSRCCSVIILSCFTSRTLWRRLLSMVYMLQQQRSAWFKWVAKSSIEERSHIFLCFLP